MHILTLWSIFLMLQSPLVLAKQEGNQQVPPDHAKIEGVILSLYDRSGDRWAAVKVTAIAAYGAGFRSALSPRDTIEVKLRSVTDASDANEGISVNDAFSGTIKQGLSGLMGSTTITYEMNNYTKF